MTRVAFVLEPIFTRVYTAMLVQKYWLQSILDCARRAQTAAEAKNSTKSGRGFQSRFPDLDLCRIASKMLWIYYLVGVCHFAQYESRPITV